jgi:hypothetical protein
MVVKFQIIWIEREFGTGDTYKIFRVEKNTVIYIKENKKFVGSSHCKRNNQEYLIIMSEIGDHDNTKQYQLDDDSLLTKSTSDVNSEDIEPRVMVSQKMYEWNAPDIPKMNAPYIAKSVKVNDLIKPLPDK